MKRPEFDSIKTYDEFIRYYWYRDELISICKEHGLKHDGGKIELNKVIEAYFNGERIVPAKRKSASKRKFQGELTRNTGLIECGFTCGPRFREFFEKETGQERFKFNVDMVATAKAVKENHDESFTLGDMLDIYYGRKTYAVYDRSALQWNKFVKEFCSDPSTDIYSNRLNAAAALWKIVRDSDMPKEYTHELFENYKEMIKENVTSTETVFLSEHCDVFYVEDKNVVLVHWKKYCELEQYRTPLECALKVIKDHPGCNYVADTRDGFEDNPLDTKWVAEYFMPKAKEYGCQIIYFIIDKNNYLKDELEGQEKDSSALLRFRYIYGIEEVPNAD